MVYASEQKRADIAEYRERFKEKFGRSPKVYDVVISDGSRKLV